MKNFWLVGIVFLNTVMVVWNEVPRTSCIKTLCSDLDLNPSSSTCTSNCYGYLIQTPPEHNYNMLSFVTMRTRIVWSNATQTARPSLSGLQSNPQIGWVDNVTFWWRVSVPILPMSTPSLSCWQRWGGYELEQTEGPFIAQLLNSHNRLGLI